MNRPIILLNEQTEDATGEAKNNTGGLFVIVCEGDFGGGSVKLQTSIAGSDWQDVYDNSGELLEISTDTDYASRITLVPSVQVRAVLSGATGADLTVKLA